MFPLMSLELLRMRKISIEELTDYLKKRDAGEEVDLSDSLLEELDLSGMDLHGICFDRCDFRNVKLDHANMSYCTTHNAFFGGSSLRGTDFSHATLCSSDFRGCDLTGANICGANIYCAALYRADLTDLKVDDETQYFHMRCPETGPFIGWKVCYGRRVVQLLIPADARRIQGTWDEIKCEKAKVLTIKSPDFQEQYEDAHSYVDENFVYKRGEMVYAEGFTGNRFEESGGGIHVWLDRESAVRYLG